MKQFIIQKNNYSKPFYADGNMVKIFHTDMDHFPYIRYYRGLYKSIEPIIHNREAGYRKRIDECYVPEYCENVKSKPNHCFQGPCSLIEPCKAKYLRLSTDKDFMSTILNNVEIPTPP